MDRGSIAGIRLNLANLHSENGDVAGAEREYRELAGNGEDRELARNGDDRALQSRALYNLAFLQQKQQRLSEAIRTAGKSIDADWSRPLTGSFVASMQLLVSCLLTAYARSESPLFLESLHTMTRRLRSRVSAPSETPWVRSCLSLLQSATATAESWSSLSSEQLEASSPVPTARLRRLVKEPSLALLLADHRLVAATRLLTRDHPHELVRKLVRAVATHLQFPWESVEDPAIDRPLSRQQAFQLLREIATLFPALAKEEGIPRENDDSDLLEKLRAMRGESRGREGDGHHVMSVSRGKSRHHGSVFPRENRKRVREEGESSKRVEMEGNGESGETPTMIIPLDNDTPMDNETPMDMDIPVNNETPIHETPAIQETPATVSISCNCILGGQQYPLDLTVPAISSFPALSAAISAALSTVCGHSTDVIRLVREGRFITSSLHIHEDDRFTAYCILPPTSSLHDALQTLTREFHLQTPGLFSLLQRLPANFPAIAEFPLSDASLADSDVFLLTAALPAILPRLAAIRLQRNALTDVAAAVLARWITAGFAPALEEADLGGNFWRGRGLRELLCAMRQNCRLFCCRVDALVLDDETVDALSELSRGFRSEDSRGFRLCREMEGVSRRRGERADQRRGEDAVGGNGGGNGAGGAGLGGSGDSRGGAVCRVGGKVRRSDWCRRCGNRGDYGR